MIIFYSFSYLRSAFQYTTNILFERWPFLVNFRYYQDEILLILEALLQSHFLAKFNSTYAEYWIIKLHRILDLQIYLINNQEYQFQRKI